MRVVCVLRSRGCWCVCVCVCVCKGLVCMCVWVGGVRVCVCVRGWCACVCEGVVCVCVGGWCACVCERVVCVCVGWGDICAHTSHVAALNCAWCGACVCVRVCVRVCVQGPVLKLQIDSVTNSTNCVCVCVQGGEVRVCRVGGCVCGGGGAGRHVWGGREA